MLQSRVVRPRPVPALELDLFDFLDAKRRPQLVDILDDLEEGELLQHGSVAFGGDGHLDPQQADGVRDRQDVDAEKVKRAHSVAGADGQQHAQVADLLELLQRVVAHLPRVPVLEDNVQVFLRQDLRVGDPRQGEDAVEARVGVDALHDFGEGCRLVCRVVWRRVVDQSVEPVVFRAS